MKATIKQGEPVYPPPTYVLELSEDEAHVIFALTGVVYGPSPMARLSDGIFEGLQAMLGSSVSKYRSTSDTRLVVRGED